MATFPNFGVGDLVNFTGREESSFSEEAVVTAFLQARLLFRLATCLKEFPDDPDMAQLARFAIVEMADKISLDMQHKETLATPFSSETIGSYSYSKKATAAIKRGEDTGVMWFDMAVAQLSVCNLSAPKVEHGGIEFFENDGFFAETENGVRWVGPADRGGYPT